VQLAQHRVVPELVSRVQLAELRLGGV